MHMIITIVQTIFHYVGIIGIVLGIIALIFGNYSRGKELLIGGIGFIVIKYLIGFIYMGVTYIIKKVIKSNRE